MRYFGQTANQSWYLPYQLQTEPPETANWVGFLIQAESYLIKLSYQQEL